MKRVYYVYVKKLASDSSLNTLCAIVRKITYITLVILGMNDYKLILNLVSTSMPSGIRVALWTRLSER